MLLHTGWSACSASHEQHARVFCDHFARAELAGSQRSCTIQLHGRAKTGCQAHHDCPVSEQARQTASKSLTVTLVGLNAQVRKRTLRWRI